MLTGRRGKIGTYGEQENAGITIDQFIAIRLVRNAESKTPLRDLSLSPTLGRKSGDDAKYLLPIRFLPRTAV